MRRNGRLAWSIFPNRAGRRSPWNITAAYFTLPLNANYWHWPCQVTHVQSWLWAAILSWEFRRIWELFRIVIRISLLWAARSPVFELSHSRHTSHHCIVTHVMSARSCFCGSECAAEIGWARGADIATFWIDSRPVTYKNDRFMRTAVKWTVSRIPKLAEKVRRI